MKMDNLLYFVEGLDVNGKTIAHLFEWPASSALNPNENCIQAAYDYCTACNLKYVQMFSMDGWACAIVAPGER